MSDEPAQIKTTTVTAQICECGRLYKDRMVDGKSMCSACYLGCDVDTLKALWSISSRYNEDVR